MAPLLTSVLAQLVLSGAKELAARSDNDIDDSVVSVIESALAGKDFQIGEYVTINVKGERLLGRVAAGGVETFSGFYKAEDVDSVKKAIVSEAD